MILSAEVEKFQIELKKYLESLDSEERKTYQIDVERLSQLLLK